MPAILGAYPTITLVGPSGDTTGVKDPAAIIRAQAASKTISFLPGTYWFGSAVPLPSNVRYQGAGRGITILKATSGLGGAIFSQTVPSGQSITGVGWRDLTIDGNTGPTGSNIGIAIDTSALNTTAYYDVIAEDVDFQNCYIGWQHAANNQNGGPLGNETLCLNCRFYNCNTGAAIGGTYASTFSECLFSACTNLAVGVTGYATTPTLSAASGPTTNLAIRGCHVEGLGNLTAASGATDSGFAAGSTQYAITDCMMSNISRYPIMGYDNEGLGSVISGIRCWGSGGPVVTLDNGGNGGGFTTVTGISCSEVSQNTHLTTAFGQQGVISVNGGNASIRNVVVAPASGYGTAPPYALNLGADGNNTVGIVDVEGFHCTSPGTSWLTTQGTQSAMTLSITNSSGYNTIGPAAPSLQATTGASGYTLVNGTGDVITWTAPNDGNLHRFIVYIRLIVQTNLTGGQIFIQNANASLANAVNGSGTFAYNANTGAGDYILLRSNVSDEKGILGPGETIKITQSTAVTVGAAVLYAEIWGS